MNYFSADFLDFFKELAANNHKDWFDENRKRYEKNVKKAFENFVNDLIAEFKKHDPSIEITHKEAIFRINRDIRFSKDKSPYKLNRSAIISPKGRKDKATPGLYLEMGPEHLRIYSGVYQPDKDQLYAIRDYIIQHEAEFNKLAQDKKFLNFFDEIRGDKNKILPKEFKEKATDIPLLFNKQFFWYVTHPAEVVLSEDLMKTVMEAYHTTKALTDFFGKAVNT